MRRSGSSSTARPVRATDPHVPAHPGERSDRRKGRDRRGQGDELAAMLTEAFMDERRVADRRR
jgi:hypothetical protein